ncbi:sulfotransferase family 2 domain-containing protein [Bacillus sp. BP-3]|uniref:sulfotransferase family 2 domain-containing protein n=1 Tax=Bacillus sp. BP-3 TaxID=3022773 RepID=UPI00233034AA|nr:sulfotransferase family 2 domain-containing protein [Bacillus sp. BP-3]MDC2863939.1 sulfotransferase family 2 domain-containing protein [Bacillus sp. BP-3]
MNEGQSSEKRSPLLLFLHIPKAGGTTLTDLICRQYSNNIHYDVNIQGILPQGVLSYKEQLTTADTLCGHFLFGIHRYLSRPFTYITMLRHPVEQVISWFYFAHKNSNQYKELFFEETIDEYVSNPKFNYSTVNLQTRCITGNDVADLQMAKEHIEKYFSVVGITELFSESLYIMKKEFGWRNINYKKLNVNTERPLKEEIPQKVIDKILEKNEVDVQLYDYARKKLENKIASLDTNSIKELRLFKRKHRL